MTRLSTAEIGCWLIKSRTPPSQLAVGWLPGQRRTLSRCLRPSYRLELMRPGQPCLLWLSGQQSPGIHAFGTIASNPQTRGPDPTGPEVEVRVDLRLLASPVPRSALLADPSFAAAEVLRMPAGSNPSYLRPDELEALEELGDPNEWDAGDW